MKATKYKVIIFDIDGTLIDTFKPSLIAMQKGLYDVTGKLYTKKELKFHFGITTNKALEGLHVPREQFNLIKDKVDNYYYQMENITTFFTGIKTLLKKLDKKNIKMGIVTSQTAYEYGIGLKTTNVSSYFDVIITADDTKYHKPNPEPIELCIKKLGCKKEEVIYIGDTIYDSMSAKSAGIAFGLATWGALYKTIQADYYLKKPSDILKLF